MPAPDERTEGDRLARTGDLASRVVSLSPGDPRVRRALHVGIGLILLLGVALALVAAFNEVPDLEWRFRIGWVLLGFLGFALYTLASSEVWRRLLISLGPELRPRPALAIWCSSSLGRYVPTGLLVPVIRIAMSEGQGVSKRICLASVVYETALAFTAAVILGAYFIIDLPDLSGEPARFLILAVPVVTLACLHPRVFRRFADLVFHRLGRESLPVVLPVGCSIEFVGLYAATMVIGGASLYALAQGVYHVDGDDWLIVVGAWSVSAAISLVAFIIPGGLVAREAAITLALAPVMPAAPALAVALLSRIAQLVFEVVFAALSPLLLRSATRDADAVSPG